MVSLLKQWAASATWIQARAQLAEDLTHLQTAINQRHTNQFSDDNLLSATTIAGNSELDTRYIANTGPHHTPKWDLVNLVNGVVGRILFPHFQSASAAARLLGRGEAFGAGDFEEITVGAGLSLTGTTLTATGGGGSGSGGNGIPGRDGEDADSFSYPPVRNGDQGATGATGATGAPGAGALILLEQHTASGSASLNFTASISSTYDDYIIKFISVVPATATQSLLWRVSTNGGSSYDASSNYYSSGIYVASGGATGSIFSSATTSATVFTNIVDTASFGGVSGQANLFNPLSATDRKNATVDVYAAQASFVYRSSGFLTWVSTTAVDAFQFFFASGNIASGTIRVYGVMK